VTGRCMHAFRYSFKLHPESLSRLTMSLRLSLRGLQLDLVTSVDSRVSNVPQHADRYRDDKVQFVYRSPDLLHSVHTWHGQYFLSPARLPQQESCLPVDNHEVFWAIA
jgi:hypothetical protein